MNYKILGANMENYSKNDGLNQLFDLHTTMTNLLSAAPNLESPEFKNWLVKLAGVYSKIKSLGENRGV